MKDKSVLGYAQGLLCLTVSNNRLGGIVSFLVQLSFIAYI